MRILVFGKGRMGTTIGNMLAKEFKVRYYDRDPEKSDVEEKDINSFDVVFLAIPESAYESILFSGLIEKDKLIVDLSSRKKRTLGMLENLENPFVSLHPLFGPGVFPEFSSIAVIKDCEDERWEKIKKYLERKGICFYKMSLEEHEEFSKTIQAISHFSILSAVLFLQEKMKSKGFPSTAFAEALFTLGERLKHQNAEVLWTIQKDAQKEREEFIEFVKKMDKMLNDFKNFERMFKNINDKSFLGNEHEFLINVAMTRFKFNDLGELRNKINVLDKTMFKIMEYRINLGKNVAEIKKKLNLPIVNKDVEERKVNEMISLTNINPFVVESVINDIMFATKEIQYSMLGVKRNLYVLGPIGSFSEEAALKILKSRIPLVYCSNITEVFENVIDSSNFGLVPVENSSTGSVIESVENLIKYDVKVIGEFKMKINHCLAALRDMDLQEIKTVCSHPQAIAQCWRFIMENLPNAKIKYATSTAKAVEMLDRFSACICSEAAARTNKLHILKKGIQDNKMNETKFYLISKDDSGKRFVEWKNNEIVTSIVFSVKNEPGSLKRVLDVFYKNKINLRKLESRPSKRKLGEYLFICEAEDNVDKEIINELEKNTEFIKILGKFSEVKKLNII